MKAGTLVRCVDASGVGFLVEGAIYRVGPLHEWMAPSRARTHVRVKFGRKYVGSAKHYWSPRRFVRVGSELRAAQAEVKRLRELRDVCGEVMGRINDAGKLAPIAHEDLRHALAAVLASLRAETNSRPGDLGALASRKKGGGS